MNRTARAIGEASVVVRAKNEAASIERCLQSLRSQTVGVQIVLVDSGSTDRTVAIAAPMCDVLVELPPESFSFGRSLNVGAHHTDTEVVFALSAHCVAEDPRWVERSLAHYADPRVGATSGLPFGPRGQVLERARPVTVDDVRTDPFWGYSNHAGSWRRQVWEQFPFDESVRSCEDKLWMWNVMMSSWLVVADPDLVVPAQHRRASGLRSLWKREFTEHATVAQLLDYPVPPVRAAVGQWWSSFPWPSERPRWQRRLNPWRTTEIVAGLVGEQLGRRRRGPETIRLPGLVHGVECS